MRYLLCLWMTLLGTGAYADATLTFGGNRGESQLVIRQGDVLIARDDSHHILVKKGRQDVVLVDHPRKQYTRWDPTTADNNSRQIASAMAQLKKEMGKMPQAQRKMMEKMLKAQNLDGLGKAKPEPKIVYTGQVTDVGGVACKVAEVQTGATTTQRLCVAARAALGMSAADYRSLTQAMERMSNLAQRSMGASSLQGMFNIGGVPIRVEDLRSGKVSELKSHHNQALSAARFQVPQGYEKKDFSASR